MYVIKIYLFKESSLFKENFKKKEKTTTTVNFSTLNLESKTSIPQVFLVSSGLDPVSQNKTSEKRSRHIIQHTFPVLSPSFPRTKERVHCPNGKETNRRRVV